MKDWETFILILLYFYLVLKQESDGWQALLSWLICMFGLVIGDENGYKKQFHFLRELLDASS